jgi:Holliday junction resolvase RusA-like endonuclease
MNRVTSLGKDLLIEFGVLGKAVPWKAPTVTRWSTFKSKRLVAWQEQIAEQAILVWQGQTPYSGPVEVHFWFVHRRSRIRDLLLWFCKRPDMDNVFKAFADTITGQACKKSTILANRGQEQILSDDNTIVSIHASKQYGERDGIYASIWTLPGSGPALPGFFNQEQS